MAALLVYLWMHGLAVLLRPVLVPALRLRRCMLRVRAISSPSPVPQLPLIQVTNSFGPSISFLRPKRRHILLHAPVNESLAPGDDATSGAQCDNVDFQETAGSPHCPGCETLTIPGYLR